MGERERENVAQERGPCARCGEKIKNRRDGGWNEEKEGGKGEWEAEAL